MKDFDYIIVGAGFYGAICARQLTDKGYKCLVVEKRPHIGGNCYTEKLEDIDCHVYGPHIFHTNNKRVWDWINGYTEFNNFILTPFAVYRDELYSLPFNMLTFNKLWNVKTPAEAEYKIETTRFRGEPTNLEEQAMSLVGSEVYEKLIKGYTTKQRKKSPKDLPKEIIKRLPVRFTYNNNYFNDKYQGIPVDGYTAIFDKLLKGIEVRLDVDYLKHKSHFDSKADNIIFTGPIDAYYDYQFGYLEYKTVEFEWQKHNVDNYQGNAIINYTEEEIPHTRIIEHKHFNYKQSKTTILSIETPVDYIGGKNEPYYPVNDNANNTLYERYKALNTNKNIHFGGRLGQYKYFDMHNIIEEALNYTDKIDPKNATN